MKITLTVILLVLSLKIDGQSLNEVRQKIQLILTPDKVTTDTTGFSHLPNLKMECDDHFNAYDFPENKKKWDYYHVVDLNHDGLNDFIYSGPCLPYDQTSIFINDGSRLKRVFEYAGQIVSIKQLSDRTILTVFKESCCCDYNSDLVDITIHHDSKVEERWITFFGSTEIQVDKMEKLKVSGILRTHPELNDSDKKDNCTDEMLKGNHLKNIVKPTEVIQLRRDGNWRLVLYPEDKKQSWIGWIKWDK
jgi:hypothetical protein